MNYRRTYIENSKIFITMVTSKKRTILIENIDILRKSFKQIKEKISFKKNCWVKPQPSSYY